MTSLFDSFSKHVHLTATEQAVVLNYINTISVAPKTLLHHSGDVSNSLYFVTSGLLRSFSISDNIVEHVLHFACEGWWIADMYSFISGKPGNLYIEVMEQTDLVVLTKNQLEQLYAEVPKLERYFRILAENALVSHQERLMDNLSLTAEDRFAKFCSRYPTLLQRVPQKQIASYIGVTPEFLSKMKAKLLKKP